MDIKKGCQDFILAAPKTNLPLLYLNNPGSMFASGK